VNRAERIRRLRAAIEKKRLELGLSERDASPAQKNLVELLRGQREHPVKKVPKRGAG